MAKKQKPNPDQLSFLPDEQSLSEPLRKGKQPKKITPNLQKLGLLPIDTTNLIEAIPKLNIRTRWEHLQQAHGMNETSLRAIVRPVQDAISIIRNMASIVEATSGCKLLVIRGGSGSGKTTFLNTLNYYVPDLEFQTQTVDLSKFERAENFTVILNSLLVDDKKMNLVVLEGRETPGDITAEYIDGIMSRINRFSRDKAVPMLFVVPTNDDTVARKWCQVAARIGGLAPTNLPGGLQWYDFPGVPKKKYIEIAEETVRVLNHSRNLTEFGFSPSELHTWVDTSDTIGQFMQTLSDKNVARRMATTQRLERRLRVWVVYCCPDMIAYDQLYHRIDALVKDEDLVVAPDKLIRLAAQDNAHSREYSQENEWAKLLTAINFLDIRLINLSIVTIITAALTYGDPGLIESFARAKLKDYEKQIPEEMWIRDKKIAASRRKTIQTDESNEDDTIFDLDEPLNRRRRQVKNTLDSLQSSNLYNLLRGMPAQPQRGGNKESSKQLAQFLHLMEHASTNDCSYFIGSAIKDLLEQQNFPGFRTIATEYPYIQGKAAPRPDVTIYTDEVDYLLELHFSRQSLATSQIARYAVDRVINKYKDELPVLKSMLDSM